MIEKGCGRVESQTRMSCRVYVCSWLAATVCVRSAAVLVHNNCSKSTNACIEQHKHMNPRKYDWQLLIKVHCTATQPDDCKTRGHTWFDVCTYKHVMSACRSTGVYVCMFVVHLPVQLWNECCDIIRTLLAWPVTTTCQPHTHHYQCLNTMSKSLT